LFCDFMVMPCHAEKKNRKSDWMFVAKFSVVVLLFAFLISYLCSYWPSFWVAVAVTVGVLLVGLVMGLLTTPMVWLLSRLSSTKKRSVRRP
jgi:hypothetical protein